MIVHQLLMVPAYDEYLKARFTVNSTYIVYCVVQIVSFIYGSFHDLPYWSHLLVVLAHRRSHIPRKEQ